MTMLLTGLVLFIGMHSLSMVALPLRDRLAARSEIGWKLFFGIVALAGLVLITMGYAELRQTPTWLYTLPGWLRYVAALLMLPAFILFLAPYFPGRIKYTFRDPQLIAVMLWAVAHMLVNGTQANVILFGSFLGWATLEWRSIKNRVSRPLLGAPESPMNDPFLIVAGIALYAAFIFWLHEVLIAVRPFGA